MKGIFEITKPTCYAVLPNLPPLIFHTIPYSLNQAMSDMIESELQGHQRPK